MKEKEIKALLNKLWIKAKKKIWTCFHKDCNKSAINSHILQKNGILSGISENGHVIELREDFFNDNQFFFKKIGVNEAFTFKGFCSEHDASIFKQIEENEIDFEDYKSQSLFAYRTILNEKRKKEILIEFSNQQKNNDKLTPNTDEIDMQIQGYREAVEDLNKYTDIILSDLENDSESFVYFVRYTTPQSVCIASHFTFETTDEMNKLMEEGVDESEVCSDIFISYFPIEDENVLIIGFLKFKEDKCGEWVRSLIEMEEPELLKQISNLILRRCEQWACSPTFYEEKIKPREAEIIQTVIESTRITDEDRDVDFSLFDSFKEEKEQNN